MADTLTKIKKRLNIDQRNLSSATVVSVSNSTAKVRLRDGSTRTAYLGDSSVTTGDQVQVAIDGNLATVQGAATLQKLSGQKTVVI